MEGPTSIGIVTSSVIPPAIMGKNLIFDKGKLYDNVMLRKGK